MAADAVVLSLATSTAPTVWLALAVMVVLAMPPNPALTLMMLVSPPVRGRRRRGHARRGDHVLQQVIRERRDAVGPELAKSPELPPPVPLWRTACFLDCRRTGTPSSAPGWTTDC